MAATSTPIKAVSTFIPAESFNANKPKEVRENKTRTNGMFPVDCCIGWSVKNSFNVLTRHTVKT